MKPHTVAVAGSHGRLRRPQMVATVLGAAGLDPTLMIGASSDVSSNARWAKAICMFVEADESDRSFLMLTPTIAVVNQHRSRAHGITTTTGRRAEMLLISSTKSRFMARLFCGLDDPHVQAVIPPRRAAARDLRIKRAGRRFPLMRSL